MWSEFLPLVTSALGGTGAACAARNDQTGAIEWAYIFGPLQSRTSEYIDHYAPLDVYNPVLVAGPRPDWLTLSDSVPSGVLSQSEWYHDFIRASGVSDIVAVQVYHDGPRRIFFGVHYEKTQDLPRRDARMHILLRHLQETARIGQIQRTLNLRASLAAWTLDHVEDALFLAFDTGRVIVMNAAAEAILSIGHSLTFRDGRLVATDAAEAEQFSALIADAAGAGALDSAPRQMLVGRADHRHSRLVTVFPFAGRVEPNEGSMVVIRVVGLLDRPSSGTGPADLFGLSPAEDRLARALLEGKTLRELTTEFGVQMPTLRAQMRSILRKCGVQRQVDLMRVLLRTN